MSAPVVRVYVEHRLVEESVLTRELSVGRGGGCGLRLDDPEVARRHGRFVPTTGGWRYEDVAGQGSYVAGGPVLGRGEGIDIQDVVQILVGSTVLEVDESAGPASRRSRAQGGAASSGSASPRAGGAAGSAARPAARIAASREGAGARRPAGATGRAGDGARRAAEPDEQHSIHPGPSRPGGAGTSGPGATGGTTSPGAAPRPPRLPPPNLDEPNLSSTFFTPLPRGPGRSHRLRDQAASRPRLLVVLDDAVDRHALPVPFATLGRSRDCDIVLPHPSVSAVHAEIRAEGDRWTITDLGSTNGTRIGEARVDEARALPSGSHVILGAVDALFVHDQPEGGGGKDPLDPEAFLDWLRARRKITRRERREVSQAVAAGPHTAEELLVLRRILSPGQLVELRHNAGQRLARAGQRRRWLPWTWGR